MSEEKSEQVKKARGPRGPKKGEGGRPPKFTFINPPKERDSIQIDFKELENLMRVQCTEEEIAGYFGASISSISKAVEQHYKITFNELRQQNRGHGRALLRKKLVYLAHSNNPTMLIWLSKQELGMKERNENVNIDLNNVSNEELKELAQAALSFIEQSEKNDSNKNKNPIH